MPDNGRQGSELLEGADQEMGRGSDEATDAISVQAVRAVVLVEDEFDQLGITAQTILEARNRFYPGWWLYPDDTEIGRLSLPIIEVDNLWDFILAKAARPRGVEGRVVYLGMSANLALLLNREEGRALLSVREEPDSWHTDADVFPMAYTILGFSQEECDLFDVLVERKVLLLGDITERLSLAAVPFVGRLVQSRLAHLERDVLFPTAAAVAVRDAVAELADQA